MRSDSPSPSWYEPPLPELGDDDDVAAAHPELCIPRDGVFWWTAAETDDD